MWSVAGTPPVSVSPSGLDFAPREQHAFPVLGGEGGDGFVTVVALPLLRLSVEVAIPAAITERNEEA